MPKKKGQRNGRGGRRSTTWKKGTAPKSPGRPKGVRNKATLEIQALAESLTTGNPKWVANTKRRLEQGREPSAVVVTLLHYAHGRPVEKVALTNPDGSKIFGEMAPEKLAPLATAAAAVLRRAGTDGV